VTEAFGTSDVSITTLPATSFYPDRSSDGFVTLADDYRSTTASNAWFESPLLLDSGVSITVLNLVACDTSTTESITATLMICPLDNDACTVRGSASTAPDADTPGCGIFGGLVDPPVVIDNAANAYAVLVFDNDNSSTTRFKAVRVPWTRTLSPADGSANFSDVPLGDARRLYVEALAAAQIATGCGAGKFCPDDPLTRGQLAVFIARALGLYFP
jgi:hypothetical protein